jgi:inhibitor of cysteine peptidase
MKRWAMAALVAVLALGTVGCAADADLVVGEADDGEAVEIAKGGTLTVELPGNPTTGYNWLVAELPECLKAPDEPGFEADSDAIGAGGTITLVFEAVSEGEGTLELQYARAWESVQPLETYSIDVTVR